MKNNIFLTSESYNVIEDLVQYIEAEENKKLLLVDTAGEATTSTVKVWIERAKIELEKVGFDVQVYTITDKSEEEIKETMKGIDVLYIAGGNTFDLLKKAQECGFIQIVRDFVEGGGIYIGQSAGSIIAGPDIYPSLKSEDKKYADLLSDFAGFGIVDFVVLPHFGQEKRKEMFINDRMVRAYGEGNKIILLTNYQYIRVQTDGMYKIEEVKH